MTDVRQIMRQLVEDAQQIHRNEEGFTMASVLVVGRLDRMNAAVNLGLTSKAFARAIGLTPDVYWKRAQAARVIHAFPRAAEMLRAGETEVSHLSAIAGKITQANADLLLAGIRHKSKRDVEALLSVVTRDGRLLDKEPEVEMRVTLTVSELKLLDRAREVLAARGQVPSTKAVLVKALGDLLHKRDPVVKAERAAVREAAALGKQVGGAAARNATASVKEAAREAAALGQESCGALTREAAAAGKGLGGVVAREAAALGQQPCGTAARKAAASEKGAARETAALGQEPCGTAASKAAASEKETAREAVALGQEAAQAVVGSIGEKEEETLTCAAGTNPGGLTHRGPSRGQTSARPAIPAAVKHAVMRRDGGQCTEILGDHSRCPERMMVEFDHKLMKCRGAGDGVDDLTLKCRQHNKAAAERELGNGYMVSWETSRGREGVTKEGRL